MFLEPRLIRLRHALCVCVCVCVCPPVTGTSTATRSTTATRNRSLVALMWAGTASICSTSILTKVVADIRRPIFRCSALLDSMDTKTFVSVELLRRRVRPRRLLNAAKRQPRETPTLGRTPTVLARFTITALSRDLAQVESREATSHLSTQSSS